MASSDNREQYDLIVVGGGPSGSTLSTLVAMRGGKVLLLDKEKFPRYTIGESLLPSTINGIAVLLGCDQEIHDAGFVWKNGGTFRWGSNPQPWKFTFDSGRSLQGKTSWAYQVERMKFDDILLQNAKRKGVEVREECAVSRVLEDGDRVVGVRYQDADGETHEVYAKYVADASGNTSRINKQAGGRRIYSDYFRNVAVFGYFEGGDRLPPPNDGDIFCPTFKDGWFWYIPLSEGKTSVGAVVHREAAGRIQGNPERALMEFINDSPEIKHKLRNATRITEGVYGEVRVRKDYSYQHTQFWRPGMLLVGDAACFVDPVLSSGVHLATYGGLVAARSVNAVLDGSVDEKKAFDEFELRYRTEYRKFYEFLIAFYNINADPESYFWEAKRVTDAEDASSLQAFAELVGGTASGELALTDAGALRSEILDSSEDLQGSIDRLIDEGNENNNPLQNSKTVRGVLQASADMQIRALLGRGIGKEKPFYEGGLVTSADGLAWVAEAA